MCQTSHLHKIDLAASVTAPGRGAASRTSAVTRSRLSAAAAAAVMLLR